MTYRETMLVKVLKAVITEDWLVLKQMKIECLDLYTQLITGVPEVLTFSIPTHEGTLARSSAFELHITQETFDKVRASLAEGQKINAIKLTKNEGWIGSDRTNTPGLREAKDFVDSL